MNSYSESQAAGLQVLNNLYQNSWDSPEFKERLIKNPHKTLEEVVGHSLSADVRFVVEDQSDASTIYLNIPSKKDLDTLELTDEQLETVSGGEVIGTVSVATLCWYAGAAIVAAGAGAVVGYYANRTDSE
ncbi:hypothetical protein [Rudanella lutea]|uniref:hypothetical protein n=1 Tax=Rudanella lutea TaxID=451374 RepID=UPI00036D5B52|nr:hypothetical protein [Rudanella lutea]